jgi:periplasmic protein TonB
MKNARVPRAFVGALAFVMGASTCPAQENSPQTPVIVYDRVGDGVTAPKAIYNPNPDYTDRARKKKIQGSVVLSIVVTDGGNVRDAKVVAGVDKDLDRQAIRTVSAWRFEPATKDGKPVAVRIKVEVDYKLY